MQNPRESPREILADLWTLAGGDLSALDAVALTGEEPQLPSSFRVAAAAQASIAAAGLAAAVPLVVRISQNIVSSPLVFFTPLCTTVVCIVDCNVISRKRPTWFNEPRAFRECSKVAGPF